MKKLLSLFFVFTIVFSFSACRNRKEINKITLYSADGRELVIAETESEKYQALGWYEMPVQTIYSEDGRTKVIAKSELEDYKANGWYESPVPKTDIVVNNNTTINNTEIIEKEKLTPTHPHEGTRTLWGVFTKNTSGNLNVRSQPKHDSELVGTIKDNTLMYYYGDAVGGMGSDGKVHQWIRIETEGSEIIGFVRRDLVDGEDFAGDGTGVIYIKDVVGNLNVRMEPKHESALMAKVTDDTRMEWLGTCEFGLGSDGQIHEWAKVLILDGSYIIGWVRTDLVKESY